MAGAGDFIPCRKLFLDHLGTASRHADSVVGSLTRLDMDPSEPPGGRRLWRPNAKPRQDIIRDGENTRRLSGCLPNR